MGVFDLHRKDYPFFWPGMGGGGCCTQLQHAESLVMAFKT